ncbi:MAG: HEAT repeat domain-containing protein [Planctomycetes bacterium]|nr:HEAT repeat domain-containing protein [Planctomycetota bacterium]
MTPSPRLALPLVLAALAFAAPADADVVRTKDGLVLEGKATKAPDGSVTVETADGRVQLPAGRVVAVEPGEGPHAALARELAALAPDDVDGRFRLALRAEQAGAPDVARAAYESVVAVAPDHPAARRALGHERLDGAWVTTDTARRARGLVLYDGRWLLAAEADALARDAARTAAPKAPAGDASVVEALRTVATGEPPLARAASLRLLGADRAERGTAAMTLLYDADPRVRVVAARELAAAGDERALRPLLFSAVRDRDATVRREAVLAAASFGHDDTAVPLVRALWSSNPQIEMNAANALADLGDPRGIVHLVKRVYSHSGGPRATVEFLNRVSYIRDYDVEIAQASNIANPMIGFATEGVVLDVRVIDASITKTVVETVLVDALSRLAGEKLKDGRAVDEWYRARATTLPDFATDPDAARRASTRAAK